MCEAVSFEEELKVDSVFWEIEQSIEWIHNLKATKIALQFSDDLLPHSFKVSKCIENAFKLHYCDASPIKTYILGDTSRAPCCVDEIAAQHISADSIIHYGYTCFSPYAYSHHQ